MGKCIRVLVVDDSATMRTVLQSELERAEELEVVGAAGNALAAREAIKTLDPDVVTLDLNMPGMDGLEFLKRLMLLRPMPVVVVSSEARDRSSAASQALTLGAAAFVLKPLRGTEPGAYDELRQRVHEAAGVSPGCRRARTADVPAPGERYLPNGRIVAIGASTGGVDALKTILCALPHACPPTLVVQHMPSFATATFAARLNETCAAEVQEATNGAPLRPGRIYLAPGGTAHLEVMGRSGVVCRLREGPAVSGHRPSVDALFTSLARSDVPALGVILTGMGNDGALGLRSLREAGARTLGQDRATSLVYGMPRVAHEIGAVEEQVALGKMADEILRRCGGTVNQAHDPVTIRRT